MKYSLVKNDAKSNARAGLLTTDHGVIETPIFMPVDDCRNRGVQLIMSHVNEQPMKVIQKSGFDKKLGEENFCAHIDDALSRAQAIVKE